MFFPFSFNLLVCFVHSVKMYILLFLSCHMACWQKWFKGNSLDTNSSEISFHQTHIKSTGWPKHNQMKCTCFCVFMRSLALSLHVPVHSRLTVNWCDVSVTSSLAFFPEDGRLPVCVGCQPCSKAMTKTSFQLTTCSCGLVPLHTLPLVFRKAMFPDWQRLGLDFIFSGKQAFCVLVYISYECLRVYPPKHFLKEIKLFLWLEFYKLFCMPVMVSEGVLFSLHIL